MRKHTTIVREGTTRFRATPQLGERIKQQGRRHDWIAQRIGVSKSFMTHVIAGRRTIAESDARVIVALIDGDFSVLFELPCDTENVSSGSASVAR